MTHRASLTIRNLDPRVKQRLRMRAAAQGHSMEEEAREILRITLASDAGGAEHFVDKIRRVAAAVGYFDDVKLPRRRVGRAPPRFK
jgi:plasmid stability protein